MDMEQKLLLAKVASALSDPIRLRILDILIKGRDETCISTPHPELPYALCPYLDVRPKLDNIAPSKLSYHLKELRDAGLVEERRMGKQVFYLVNHKTVEQFLQAVKESYLIPLPDAVTPR
ncbi:ArsR/SmtB family transcription factor [Ktedonosporobacter rubrisoli]|nr:metalloregulator ArsR/SmtB family transcription factor [Ktedonosporobacter rubrisoli]